MSAQEPIYLATFLISVAAVVAAVTSLFMQSNIAPDVVLLLPGWLRSIVSSAPDNFIYIAIGVVVGAQALCRLFDLLVDWLDPR